MASNGQLGPARVMRWGNLNAWVLGLLMLTSSVSALLLRPKEYVAQEHAPVVLSEIFPQSFGEWREDPQRLIEVVDPQTRELLDRIYSDTLDRRYIDKSGYEIMLSVAYGTDQRLRNSLAAHKPEVCYPAQGFSIRDKQPVDLKTRFGTIPAVHFFATLNARQEPVTYWFTVGQTAPHPGLQRRWIEIEYGLTGRIPDGMLVRVSSIDPDPSHAYAMHQLFVDELLASINKKQRTRIAGL